MLPHFPENTFPDQHHPGTPGIPDPSVDLLIAQNLPLLLVSLLERRYLNDLKPHNWQLTPHTEEHSCPLLCEIVSLSRTYKNEEWPRRMSAALNACHSPGHALVMVLHGDGEYHHLYMGARRLLGMGAGSTEDYLAAQEGALKAHFSGLQMNEDGPRSLNHRELPALTDLLHSAPALSIITGIPSAQEGRFPLSSQSIDQLVKAVGQQRFALMVVAEPLEAQVLDATLDACRRLRSEISSYLRHSISRHRSGEESTATNTVHTEKQLQDNGAYILRPLLTLSLQFLENAVKGAQIVPAPGRAFAGRVINQVTPTIVELIVSALGGVPNQGKQSSTTSTTTRTGWQESESQELRDANAEACELLLQQHIERLNVGRRSGWWRSSIYVAAESEATQQRVIGALRSMSSGDATSLEPFRVMNSATPLVRDAILHGQILQALPLQSKQGHPLGSSFDALATCISSEELSVLVNVPQQELPGLPIRDHSQFALTVPPVTEPAITLGKMQDGQGEPLGQITLTAEELNRHCFITGITGYGKTNTCMQILLEAYEKLHIPFLVVEPAKTEYRRLREVPFLRNRLRIYTIGGDTPTPFRLNPLQPVPGISLGRHIDLLKSIFNASFPMFAGMSYVLEEALLDVFTERGWSLYTSQNPYLPQSPSLQDQSALLPDLQELHDRIEVVLERKKYGQEVHQSMGAALRSRLQSLLQGNKGLTLNTRRSIPLQDLFAAPAVIELQNLGDDEEKAFLMAVLFTLLYEYAEVRQSSLTPERSGRLQHLTLIEEAHRLLRATPGRINPEVGDPSAKAVTMFTDMLAEMRAYGEGFLIADQIPTKLAPETLKNSNVKIIHRLAAPDDRQVAGQCINLNEMQMRHLNTLAPGMAVVHSERLGEAVLARILPAKEMYASIAPINYRGEHAPLQREDRFYLYRHAGCRSCPSPCDFYHRVQYERTQTFNNWRSLAAAFLESVLFDDVETAWHHWTTWSIARLDQRKPQAESGKTQDETGTSYCSITQEAYTWLAELLVKRSSVFKQGHTMYPADRLLRETMAQALSPLLLDWVQREHLDENGRHQFLVIQQQLRDKILKQPPHKRSGCANCPVQCQVLPIVAPHLSQLDKNIESIVTDTLSPETLIVRLRTRVKQIPQLAQRIEDPRFAKGILYCLLTNAQLSPRGQAGQQELLNAVLTLI